MQDTGVSIYDETYNVSGNGSLGDVYFGQSLTPTVPVSVTIDNIEETVIADGFRTWEEICVGEFEQYCP